MFSRPVRLNRIHDYNIIHYLQLRACVMCKRLIDKREPRGGFFFCRPFVMTPRWYTIVVRGNKTRHASPTHRHGVRRGRIEFTDERVMTRRVHAVGFGFGNFPVFQNGFRSSRTLVSGKVEFGVSENREPFVLTQKKGDG